MSEFAAVTLDGAGYCPKHGQISHVLRLHATGRRVCGDCFDEVFAQCFGGEELDRETARWRAEIVAASAAAEVWIGLPAIFTAGDGKRHPVVIRSGLRTHDDSRAGGHYVRECQFDDGLFAVRADRLTTPEGEPIPSTPEGGIAITQSRYTEADLTRG